MFGLSLVLFGHQSLVDIENFKLQFEKAKQVFSLFFTYMIWNSFAYRMLPQHRQPPTVVHFKYTTMEKVKKDDKQNVLKGIEYQHSVPEIKSSTGNSLFINK